MLLLVVRGLCAVGYKEADDGADGCGGYGGVCVAEVADVDTVGE